MNKYFTVFFIFLFSCAAQPFKAKRYVDPLLKPYVESFEQYFDVYADVNAVFEKLEEPYAGLCHYGFDRTIKIDTEFYSLYQYDSDAIEELVYHELLHCVFLLDHDDRLGTVGAYNNIPSSIMYHTTFGWQYYYKENKEYYYAEAYNKVYRK